MAKLGKLSVFSLVDAEADLLPQIEELKRKENATIASPLAAILARPTEKLWEGLDVDEKRAILRVSVEVRMMPIGGGRGSSRSDLGIAVHSILPSREALKALLVTG